MRPAAPTMKGKTVEAKTLTALQESIAHWESNVSDPEKAPS